jgi:hypothetical protein
MSSCALKGPPFPLRLLVTLGGFLLLTLQCEAEPSRPRLHTASLEVPADSAVSEPHLTRDPRDPESLVAVAQVDLFDRPRHLLWRSEDGGVTWSSPLVMGGSDNSEFGIAADPVVAAGRGRELVFAGLLRYGTTSVVGTRVSHNDGVSFTEFGRAESVNEPKEVDKPWVAVDESSGEFGGRVYLAWLYFRIADPTRPELRFAVSNDGGRTYGSPLMLMRTIFGGFDVTPEPLAQVAVRPDGTVDVVWNQRRNGALGILHAFSNDGGASFSKPKAVAPLDESANAVGIVSSLAVSSSGRLAVCWSQSVSDTTYDPRVLCAATGPAGSWGEPRAILPEAEDRQYLPAAAFQRERLWVASYISDSARTRLVLVASDEGDASFGTPRTVGSWNLGDGDICAPHPPDCGSEQTFIGDYIGLVAAPERVSVAYVAPALPQTRNRMLVSSLHTP